MICYHLAFGRICTHNVALTTSLSNSSLCICKLWDIQYNLTNIFSLTLSFLHTHNHTWARMHTRAYLNTHMQTHSFKFKHTHTRISTHAKTDENKSEKGAEKARRKKRERTKTLCMCILVCVHPRSAWHACMCVWITDKSVKKKVFAWVYVCNLRDRTCTQILSLSLFLSHTRTNTRATIAHPRSHAHSFTLADLHTYAQKCTHTHTKPHNHPHADARTHTHTHTYKHAHTRWHWNFHIIMYTHFVFNSPSLHMHACTLKHRDTHMICLPAASGRACLAGRCGSVIGIPPRRNHALCLHSQTMRSSGRQSASWRSAPLQTAPLPRASARAGLLCRKGLVNQCLRFRGFSHHPLPSRCSWGLMH